MFRLRLSVGLMAVCLITLAFALQTSAITPPTSPTPTPSPSPSPTPFDPFISINDVLPNLDLPTPSEAPAKTFGTISLEGTALFIMLVSLVGICIAGILLNIKDQKQNQNPL